VSETVHEDLKKQLQILETNIREHLDLIKEQQDEAKKRKQEL